MVDKFETIKDPYPGMIGWFGINYHDGQDEKEIVILVQVVDIRNFREDWDDLERVSLEVVPFGSDTSFLINPVDLMARRTVDTREKTVHCPG